MSSPDWPTRPAHSAEPNVTPMLDVMLVLLVIFLVLVVRDRRAIDAQLSQTCAACESGAGIVLEILPGPSYRLNRAPLPATALATRLREVYAGRPDKVIQIVGDPSVTYQDVLSAMDVARGAGVRVIGLPKQAPTPDVR
jgi:biopolymer transport protein TolR